MAVFRAVVRSGGVTAASRELGVSQPAVSQALAELESSLGTRLLKRDKSGIELTPDGALFLSYAERSERLSAEVEALFSKGTERKVTISAPASLVSYVEAALEPYSSRIECVVVPEGNPSDIAIVTTPLPDGILLGRIYVSFVDSSGEVRSSGDKRLYARVSEEFKSNPLRKVVTGILGGKS